MFEKTQQGFESRWKPFAKQRNFKYFSAEFSDAEILQDFEIIRNTRAALYYENPEEHPWRANPDFERSQEILTQGFHKAPHLVAFDYNRTDTSYNSSNIIVNGHKFLAMEGPQKPQHVNNFLRLLVNYNVKHVIRLTNDIEKEVFKAQNYWHDKVNTDPDGNSYLQYLITEEESKIPYKFKYYAIDNWSDNTGTSPDTLLQLVTELRKDYKSGDLVAVHCSAGVGRTGTFIASFILLDEIDRQLASGKSKKEVNLSIEKLVYQLSLQRAYLVGEPAQYLALHQLARLYLN